MKVNIVGAGLAGSLVARTFHRAGHEVVVFDDQDARSASAASSNLYISGWLKKFSAQGRAGLEALEALGLKTDQPFARGIADAAKVRHVRQEDVLIREPAFSQPVTAVTPKGVAFGHVGWKLQFSPADYTVLCCGYRCGELLAESVRPDMHVKVGHAAFFRGRLPEGQSRLAIVSPYRHEKLYQWDDETIYYADSVAVKLDTYERRKDELRQTTLDRAYAHLPERPELVDFRVGYRPFIPGHDFGRCWSVSDRVWCLNGGGKSGMVAYAYWARWLLEVLS